MACGHVGAIAGRRIPRVARSVAPGRGRAQSCSDRHRLRPKDDARRPPGRRAAWLQGAGAHHRGAPPRRPRLVLVQCLAVRPPRRTGHDRGARRIGRPRPDLALRRPSRNDAAGLLQPQPDRSARPVLQRHQLDPGRLDLDELRRPLHGCRRIRQRRPGDEPILSAAAERVQPGTGRTGLSQSLVRELALRRLPCALHGGACPHPRRAHRVGQDVESRCRAARRRYRPQGEHPGAARQGGGDPDGVRGRAVSRHRSSDPADRQRPPDPDRRHRAQCRCQHASAGSFRHRLLSAHLRQEHAAASVGAAGARRRRRADRRRLHVRASGGRRTRPAARARLLLRARADGRRDPRGARRRARHRLDVPGRRCNRGTAACRSPTSWRS